MNRFNCKIGAVGVMAALLLLSGCREGAVAVPEEPSAGAGGSPAVSFAPAPFASATTLPTSPAPSAASPASAGPATGGVQEGPSADAEAVRIVLDSEPRLVSPIQTTVYPADQTFTLTFGEDMDRQSVERAIAANGTKESGMETRRMKIVYRFDWSDDRKLKLTVDAAEPEEPGSAASLYPLQRYTVDTAGASTQTGRLLSKPPGFTAVVLPPVQLWRVSSDGRVREKLSDFREPVFRLEVPSKAAPLAIAYRLTEYCECDRRSPYLSAVYDSQHQSALQPYPSEIMMNYTGKGDFYAYPGGYFAEAPGHGEKPVPGTDGAVHVRPEGYIWGTAWSKDGRRIIMARSAAREQVTDLELLVFDTETRTYKSYPSAIRGELPDREVSSEKIPVDFMDDGEYVHFSVWGPGEEGTSRGPARYRYHWKTETLSAWEPPVESPYWWIGFKSTDDGTYRLYVDGTLFRDGKQAGKLQEHVYYGSYWLPGTHRLIYGNGSGELRQYDAGSMADTALVQGMPEEARPAGVSPDGKWIYIETRAPLPPNA